MSNRISIEPVHGMTSGSDTHCPSCGRRHILTDYVEAEDHAIDQKYSFAIMTCECGRILNKGNLRNTLPDVIFQAVFDNEEGYIENAVEKMKIEGGESPTNIMLVCKECSNGMYPHKGQFDIDIGDFAKIKFSGEHTNEFMWIKVTNVNGEEFEGILDNDPVDIKNIKCGDSVRFRREDVCDKIVE